MFELIVAVYTALGGQFDVRPHVFATFADHAACTDERKHVEGRSYMGVQFVAVCKPVVR